jgi:hypothetical protein
LAILNNSLVNPTGLKWTECDFLQEGYNKWLEEMVEHKGGDFDDHFYRHTLAPNVMHFLRMKEQIQSAFELKPRGKTHAAPHLRNEFQQLLRMHKEDELHLFRSGRTNGHAAINFLEQGLERLADSRMKNFVEQSTAYSDVMTDVLDPKEISDEQFQRDLDKLIAQANREPTDDSDLDSDSELEDGEGDDTLHGMKYSDDEEESDSELEDDMPRDAGNISADDEPDEGSDGDEISELEDQDVDKFIDLGVGGVEPKVN